MVSAKAKGKSLISNWKFLACWWYHHLIAFFSFEALKLGLMAPNTKAGIVVIDVVVKARTGTPMAVVILDSTRTIDRMD